MIAHVMIVCLYMKQQVATSVDESESVEQKIVRRMYV
jgi:uncharacterized protein YnzC (UPF0291/DUF896 family)